MQHYPQSLIFIRWDTDHPLTEGKQKWRKLNHNKKETSEIQKKRGDQKQTSAQNLKQ